MHFLSNRRTLPPEAKRVTTLATVCVGGSLEASRSTQYPYRSGGPTGACRRVGLSLPSRRYVAQRRIQRRSSTGRRGKSVGRGVPTACRHRSVLRIGCQASKNERASSCTPIRGCLGDGVEGYFGPLSAAVHCSPRLRLRETAVWGLAGGLDRGYMICTRSPLISVRARLNP